MIGEFKTVEIGSILEKVANAVTVEPDAQYRQIGIRSHGKGLFDKEPVTGAELGDKRVFWVEPDCFVVNIVFAWEMAVSRTTEKDVGKIASHRFPMFRPKAGRADVDYITYLFKTERGRELLALASPGGAGRNKTLGQGEFLKLKVSVPPFAEQQRIAEVLSTWDRAIETVEAMVANAQAEKGVLMRLLLTGERRWPGATAGWRQATEAEGRGAKIPEGWRLKRLGELFDFKNGLNAEKAHYGSGIKFANVMDVFRGPQLRTSQILGSMQATEDQVAIFSLRFGDVLFNRTSETDDEIALSTVYLDTGPAVFGGFVIRARPKGSELDAEYCAYAFSSEAVRREMIRRGQGAIRSNIGQGDLCTVPILLPPLPEQRWIAEILSSRDRALDAMQAQLRALYQEKAALMQQLLTGKRRVAAVESEAA